MKEKRGRPKKDNDLKRRHRITVRLNDYEYNQLNLLCQATGLTPTQSLRINIDDNLISVMQQKNR